MPTYRIAGILALTASALVGGAGMAHAGTVGISTESGITANATIDWTSLGLTGTDVSNPFTISTSLSGLDATISQAGSSAFLRADQDDGWAGNFASGEQLLWSNGGNGPISFLFNVAVRGIGAQIQANLYGTFSATIEAFDAADVSLGSYTRTDGDSNEFADDSAIFLGIRSDTADIRRVTLSVTSGLGDDFAINGPRIETQVVPLPPSALLGLGLLGGLGLVRLVRSRRQTTLA